MLSDNSIQRPAFCQQILIHTNPHWDCLPKQLQQEGGSGSDCHTSPAQGFLQLTPLQRVEDHFSFPSGRSTYLEHTKLTSWWKQHNSYLQKSNLICALAPVRSGRRWVSGVNRIWAFAVSLPKQETGGRQWPAYNNWRKILTHPLDMGTVDLLTKEDLWMQEENLLQTNKSFSDKILKPWQVTK